MTDKKNITKEHHDEIKKREKLEEKCKELENKLNEINSFNNFLQTKLLQEKGNSLNWEYQFNTAKQELESLKEKENEKENPKKEAE